MEPDDHGQEKREYGASSNRLNKLIEEEFEVSIARQYAAVLLAKRCTPKIERGINSKDLYEELVLDFGYALGGKKIKGDTQAEIWVRQIENSLRPGEEKDALQQLTRAIRDSSADTSKILRELRSNEKLVSIARRIQRLDKVSGENGANAADPQQEIDKAIDRLYDAANSLRILRKYGSTVREGANNAVRVGKALCRLLLELAEMALGFPDVFQQGCQALRGENGPEYDDVQDFIQACLVDIARHFELIDTEALLPIVNNGSEDEPST